MMQWDRLTLGRMAKELGFPRDTLEKVCRLADVLKFMESDELLSEGIALKGGTAINLTIFDLPRLSVDIDLDYCRSIEREEMLADRGIITDKISKYMMANGYVLSPKSKSYHALDSFVYEYVNCGGTKDNLKIEINYMLRCHVLPVARREVRLPWNEEKLFWKAFSEGNYYPDWVFGDSDEFRNVAKHPMALWKCRDKEEDKKPLDKDHEKRV